MHFCRMTFQEAVAYLLELELPQKAVASSMKERGQLILPDKAPNYRRVAWYLTQVRGIAPEILSLLMHEKKLYQQDKTGNCVFVGYDQEGVASIALRAAPLPTSHSNKTESIRTKVIRFIYAGIPTANRYMYVKVY